MSSASIPQAGSVQRAQPRRLPLFWRVLSYLFLFVLVNLVANLARVGLDTLHVPSLITRLVFALVYIGGVLGITFIYRRFVDARPWSALSLRAGAEQLSHLRTGLVIGVGVVVMVFAIEFAMLWIRVEGSAETSSILTLLLDSLLLSAAFGASEEICMRGYLFQNLGERLSLWQATLITGIIFGAFHLLSVGFGTRGITFFIFTLVLNLFLVLSRLATRSLWFAIAFHTAFDWAAINLGLGSVVLADQHLLGVQHLLPLPAEDLLATAVVGLAAVFLRVWMHQNNILFTWNARLDDEGRVVMTRE
jgi:membrane protease YdiL (CAAX protease family)